MGKIDMTAVFMISLVYDGIRVAREFGSAESHGEISDFSALWISDEIKHRKGGKK